MKNRIPYWDNVKLFLILMVVIGHFSDTFSSPDFKSIFLFIYAFHMPLFIFISGLFHSDRKLPERVLGFLLIYLCFHLLIFYTNSKALDGNFTRIKLLSSSGEPWFLFASAVFLLLTYCLRRFNLKLILLFFVLFACVSGYDSTIGDTLCLSRIIVFYPFYLLGVLLSKEQALTFCKQRKTVITSLFVIGIWAYLCVFHRTQFYVLRHLFTGRNPYNDDILPFGFLYRLLCYLISLLVGGAVLSLIPRRNFGFLTRSGSRTLQVYFWHRSFIQVLKYYHIPETICVSPFGKLVWLLLAVLLTLLLALPCFSFPTKQLLQLSSHR